MTIFSHAPRAWRNAMLGSQQSHNNQTLEFSMTAFFSDPVMSCSDPKISNQGSERIFTEIFTKITENQPFPWQISLYKRFANGDFPASTSIPTGLGKTSVVAIWLIALALRSEKVPRRLVYVVNRRTVVDQTTSEAVKLSKNLLEKPDLASVADALRGLCAIPLSETASPLAISTLRGQFADNGEWRADPARPAVIIGTVDMIGSGLLFSRYTVGFKSRPHHAALLGQDALLIHDEAHLEPAFQHLLDEIVSAQISAKDLRKLRVMALTATQRNNTSEPFGLSDDDRRNTTITKRHDAAKKLVLESVEKDGVVCGKMIELALAEKDSGRAILIFVRSVENAEKIAANLESKKCAVVTLTGTMRGKERDNLVDSTFFQRFLHPIMPTASEGRQPTVYLVATSAGEVGVNISADDLICDLSTYESMAQRFGRVNRFGDRADTRVTVVYAQDIQQKYDEGLRKAEFGGKDAEKRVKAFKVKNRFTVSLMNTLAILQKLESANSAALSTIPVAERDAAFSPQPKIREATDIQFDAWALTSIVKPIAARPPVAPYLHGEAEWEPPETRIAWREEVGLDCGAQPEELLDDWPLNPQELLRDRTDRIYDRLLKLVEAKADVPAAWLIREHGNIEIFPLAKLLSDNMGIADGAEDESDHEDSEEDEPSAKEEIDIVKKRKARICAILSGTTMILPVSLCGLSQQGFLDPKGGNTALDVSETPSRKRIRSAAPMLSMTGFNLLRSIDTLAQAENISGEVSDRYWLWYESRDGLVPQFKNTDFVTLAAHSAVAAAHASAIARKLYLGENIIAELAVGAQGHDNGKNRRRWQRGIGNIAYDPAVPTTILAKSDTGMRPLYITDAYRHEFGSIRELQTSDLCAHIIAAHHGRARPHFPLAEAFDPECDQAECFSIAAEVPRRFADLQNMYGRWGLAWLESILRAADYAASAGIAPSGETNDPAWAPPDGSQPVIGSLNRAVASPAFSIRLDPTNPGHYFACCGLFELAARLHPEATAWFSDNGAVFHVAETGSSLLELLNIITSAEITAIDATDRAKTPLFIDYPFRLYLDWWRIENYSIGKLKPWAGNTSVLCMAIDMQATLKLELRQLDRTPSNLLDISSTANTNEPFYFDPDRALNAKAVDIGFSPDKLNKASISVQSSVHPAVEFLCLIGLQRGRPLLATTPYRTERAYDYSVWKQPLPISILPAAVAGFLSDSERSFRFTNPSRTKDYRAFLPAKRITTPKGHTS